MKNIIKKIFWPGPDFGTRSRYSLKKRLLTGKNIRTLDVGFGNACMTIYAATYGAYAKGVTILENEIEKAKLMAKTFGLNENSISFEKKHFIELEEKNEKFDQIIMFEVLEHIENDLLALNKCHKLLNDKGLLHITVPNRDNHIHFEGVSRFENGSHVRHGYHYTGIEQLLINAGFEPVDRIGVGKLGTIIGFLIVAKIRKLPLGLGQLGSLLSWIIFWPFEKILNLLPCIPWSLYILAKKKS